MMRLAELHPNNQFIGIDLSPEAVGTARGEASRKDLGNIEFITWNLGDFDSTAEPEVFDFITTFDAIHDQAKPFNVLKGIQRALKSDGLYLMQDIRGSSTGRARSPDAMSPAFITAKLLIPLPSNGLSARGVVSRI